MTKQAKITPSTKPAVERLQRGGAPDVRGERGANTSDERTHGGVEELSIDELEQLVRTEFEQTALPNPPAIPGYHLCWLTTTSTYDSIEKRHRLGYTPVRRSEVPNFESTGKSSLQQFEGCVSCNEMVLHKITEPRYQAIMRYFHHKRPLEDEAAILAKIKNGNAAERDSTGRALGETEGDGIETLERRVAADERLAAPEFQA